MKKWIHAASIPEFAKKAAEARKELKTYDPEKVEYVRKCKDDILKAISDKYIADLDEDNDEISQLNLKAIKTDWLIGAIEDDLMTEEEFEDILALLDLTDMEDAHAWA